MDKQIKIAKISAAHGIRGELKLQTFLEDPDSLSRYNPLVSRQGKSYSLSITGHAKDQLIVRIDGISDRNAAESLKGLELFTSEDKLPAKSEGEYYTQELIGLDAVADGKVIGKVSGIHNFGAGDIIEIGELMLPFKAPFVGEIDVEKGTVRVSIPNYLGDEKP